MWLIVDRINADIWRKLIALGIWIGVCIDELQIGGECCHRLDLPNVDEAYIAGTETRTRLTKGAYILTSFSALKALVKAPLESGRTVVS